MGRGGRGLMRVKDTGRIQKRDGEAVGGSGEDNGKWAAKDREEKRQFETLDRKWGRKVTTGRKGNGVGRDEE